MGPAYPLAPFGPSAPSCERACHISLRRLPVTTHASSATRCQHPPCSVPRRRLLAGASLVDGVLAGTHCPPPAPPGVRALHVHQMIEDESLAGHLSRRPHPSRRPPRAVDPIRPAHPLAHGPHLAARARRTLRAHRSGSEAADVGSVGSPLARMAPAPVKARFARARPGAQPPSLPAHVCVWG